MSAAGVRDQLAICLVPNNPVAHAAIVMARANFNPLLAKTEIDARARAQHINGQLGPNT
jgi:hypothetical protein